MFAASVGSTLWYLARGTGLVSIVLLTMVMVFGIAQVQRFATEGWPRFVIAGLHKNLSLLVVVFLAIHISSSVIDAFAPIPWIAAVVPFVASYRPIWLGLGALSFDLLLALVISSLVRQRIGPRLWRVIHWTAYGCWPIALVHGLGTGSDTRVGWVQVLYLLCLAAVIGSIVWRLATGWSTDPIRRSLGIGAIIFVILVVLGWSLVGPTQTGWARKAGTPESVLAKISGSNSASDPGSEIAATDTSISTANAVKWTLPFGADFSGSAVTDGNTTTATVTIDGTLSGGAAGHLHIVISGPPVDGGGVRMKSSKVTTGPLGKPDQYAGTVTALTRGQITAVVKSTTGEAISMVVTLKLDDGAQTASGTVAAQAGS